MRKVAFVMVLVLTLSSVTPAFAGVVQQTSLSADEAASLAAQEVQTAPTVTDLSAGDDSSAGLGVLVGVALAVGVIYCLWVTG